MFNILHLDLRHSAAPVALDELDLMCSSVEAHVVMTGDHHLLVSRVAQEDIRACGDQHAWLPTLSRAQRQPHKLLRQHLYIFSRNWNQKVWHWWTRSQTTFKTGSIRQGRQAHAKKIKQLPRNFYPASASIGVSARETSHEMSKTSFPEKSGEPTSTQFLSNRHNRYKT